MRKYLSVLFLAALSIAFFICNLQKQEAQENVFRKLEILGEFPRPTKTIQKVPSAQIKDIQVFGEQSGIAFTSDSLFRTDDNGETWREIVLPRDLNESVSAVSFFNENSGWAILGDEQSVSLQLAKTQDGGNSWTKVPVNLNREDLSEANFDKVLLEALPDSDDAWLRIDLSSSSNFKRFVLYKTRDGGQNWEVELKQLEKQASESDFNEKMFGENVIARVNYNANYWSLTSIGSCEGFKAGCLQETKIFNRSTEITPPQIKELARREKELTKLEAADSVFAFPPGGATRTSLNRGFDKCTAAPAAQMQAWWDSSPFYDANIYISGRNRGCAQPQLTAAWVDQVSTQGWGLIPTIVGYQAPCSVCANCAKHSSDPATAEQQGRGEADIAIADANVLGLTQGTVLYYDMERYDDLSGTGACSTPVKAFLKGWTDRVKELGYVSGVYGSPTNAVGDWLNIPEASRMDAVWLARWDNVPSVWFYASPSPVVPQNVWANHQRIKQWQAPHNETWGGVTFNIDGNLADGPVAGIRPAKNKPADFDGDRKTDISVWRPETGVWYVANSSNASYSILSFGLSTDVLAPGDYDGDGKTDFAVFRPETGVWHIYSRSIYRSLQFGAAGDIPVPADYNGDGYTDPAVFRPSNGVWYIWNSSGGPNPYRIEQFGLSGDKPVSGDYDGDGRADLAVYRPSNGVWYLLQSTNGFTATQFGISTDLPVAADYDGDGRTDLGVYRDGVWYLLQSTNGFAATQFGLAGDKPAPGDYDGDGKFDIAVFRPSTGVWYILQTQAGVLIAQFGLATDNPVPAAYTPQN